MTLTEAKEELDKFVRLKTTMRPTFADVLMSDDVQEVKHGRWIEASSEDPCDYRCAECGWLMDDEYYYCPNCGALMTDEVDDGN